jgi:type IV pilus assembly protein PilA
VPCAILRLLQYGLGPKRLRYGLHFLGLMTHHNHNFFRPDPGARTHDMLHQWPASRPMQHFRHARFQPCSLARGQDHNGHIFVFCHSDSIVPCPGPFDNLSLRFPARFKALDSGRNLSYIPRKCSFLFTFLECNPRSNLTVMNCPYCAQVIPEEVAFCPKCGTQMGSPLPSSPQYRQPLAPGFEAPTSGKAIGSLVCGLFFFFLPASILAVVLGHLSLSEIRKSAGRLKGQGIATVGLALGYVGVAAIPFILIIAAIAIPNLLRAKMAANEASAVGALRSYSYALATYSSTCPKIGFPTSLANLGHGAPGGCQHAGVLDGILAREMPVRSGYTFHYSAGTPSNLGQATSFIISAEPITANTTGRRFFYVDQTGVIRVSTAGPANEDSPPL